jgi:anhydro-N-acetylmuramic acid kinase
MKDYDCFLNLGGIANISVNMQNSYSAFDVCAANRVLNLLSAQEGKTYDEEGALAASGSLHLPLLIKLNALDYYEKPHPKSLANSFGTDEVYPLIQSYGLTTADALRTYVEHIVMQVTYALQYFKVKEPGIAKLFVTGGGAFNRFLVDQLKQSLDALNIEVTIPDPLLVNFKEALIMALIGVLRWREEYNVLDTVTGARRSSIGGAVWIGQEA